MEIPQSRIYIIYSRATLLFYFLKWECEVKKFLRFNVIYFCRLLFEIGPGKVSPLPLGISGKMQWHFFLFSFFRSFFLLSWILCVLCCVFWVCFLFGVLMNFRFYSKLFNTVLLVILSVISAQEQFMWQLVENKDGEVLI